MSRKMKFRGKQINGTGEFVYGSLLKGETAEGKALAYIIPCGTRYEVMNGRLHRNTPLFEIDPETVGQFTGMRDTQESYEGDLVRWTSLYIEGEAIGEITYLDGCWFIQGERHNGLLSDCLTCKVIGNVFDNPELPEVSK